jgi:ABC-type multidrug transport system ATPase subunit
MAQLSARQLAKKFKNDWIFRDFDFDFLEGGRYAITGPNGSGKSTLLQVVAGMVPPTSGQMTLQLGQRHIPYDDFHAYFALCSPALELLGELTLAEFLRFHFQFRELRKGITLAALPEILQLGHAAHKELKNFSSGMLQRIKLGIAFYSEVPVLLLDEPTTNLDEEGVAWYLQQVAALSGQKIVLVASNNPHEYAFCDQEINISTYKKANRP